MTVATQTAAVDPKTGRIDMDLLTTGRSAGDRERMEQMFESIKALLEKTRGGQSTVKALQTAFNEQSQEQLGQREFGELIDQLITEDYVVSYRGKIRLR